jgi:hypothetical protein
MEREKKKAERSIGETRCFHELMMSGETEGDIGFQFDAVMVA